MARDEQVRSRPAEGSVVLRPLRDFLRTEAAGGGIRTLLGEVVEQRVLVGGEDVFQAVGVMEAAPVGQLAAGIDRRAAIMRLVMSSVLRSHSRPIVGASA